MKNFKQFQESVASLALKGGVKFLPKILPKIPSALKAVTAGALTGLTVLQAKRDRPKADKKTVEVAKDLGLDLTDPRQRRKAQSRAVARGLKKQNKTNKKINRETGEVIKPRYDTKLKDIKIEPKKGEKKDSSKTLKDYLKARKKEGETMYNLKQDAEMADKGPGDLLPDAKKIYLNKLLSNLKNKNTNK